MRIGVAETGGKTMHEVGDSITFTPTAWGTACNGSDESRKQAEQKRVKGVVERIHRAHGWYRLAYQTEYYGTQFECFHERGG